jgi:hypothetical protein
MKTSPTQRTLVELRRIGYQAAVTERWNPHAKIRQDLFGCIDILACMPGIGILGVQACAGPSHAARRAKMIEEPRLRVWIESGGRAEVWSWALRGKQGRRKLYTLRREEITLEMLTSDVNGEAVATAEAGR